MGEDRVGQYVTFLVDNSRAIAVVLLALTVLVGAGVVVADTELRIAQFEVDSAEEDAETEIQSQFSTEERTVSQVVVRSNDEVNDTVAKEHLLETLELQQEIRSNETVNRTLSDVQPTIGVGNAIAIRTDPRIGFEGSPPIGSKMSVLEDRQDHMNRHVLGLLLDDPKSTPEGLPPVSSLLERGYDVENDTADARLIVVVHNTTATDDELVAAQETIETLADDNITADTFVFGQALAFDRGATATGESFRLIGPLVLLLMFGLLAVAYRDLFDVLLSGVGIGLVLLWTAGLAGWAGITFTQLLVAVPCLLVGLSIDYSLHIVMRYREALGGKTAVSADQAMTRGLAGVLLAIVATTATTTAGFLSGVISPIGILREFGVVAALGVLSALVVFGALVPTLKIELERWRGDRKEPRSLSVGSLAPLSLPLRYSARVANRIPVVVIVLALVLAVGGAFGATAVDTSTDRTDFLPEDPQAWMTNLPEELRPADNGVREKATFIDETFEEPWEPTVDILIRGSVTNPATLERLHGAEQAANDSAVSVVPADGSDTVRSPLDAIESAADDDPDAAAVLAALENGEDHSEIESLDAVYDAAFEADADTANATINRTENGEYEALRMTVTVDENTTGENVTADLRETAAIIDDSSGLDAIATGQPILEYLQERAILETVLGTLLLAMVVITAILTAVFRRRHASWTLGFVTIAPVLLSIPWLIGTMSVLSISYNAETALLTAIAIGLGTDYTIHLSERFLQERRSAPRLPALKRTLSETGGVVFASGVTTAAAFAVLTLTVVPSLQRFGFVTGLAVLYALAASLLVLPSLLVVWDRYSGATPSEREAE